MTQKTGRLGFATWNDSSSSQLAAPTAKPRSPSPAALSFSLTLSLTVPEKVRIPAVLCVMLRGERSQRREVEASTAAAAAATAAALAAEVLLAHGDDAVHCEVVSGSGGEMSCLR